jgi:hypothetical protein
MRLTENTRALLHDTRTYAYSRRHARVVVAKRKLHDMCLRYRLMLDSSGTINQSKGNGLFETFQHRRCLPSGELLQWLLSPLTFCSSTPFFHSFQGQFHTVFTISYTSIIMKNTSLTAVLATASVAYAAVTKRDLTVQTVSGWQSLGCYRYIALDLIL